MVDAREKERAGLCATCRHARVLRSDRGAVFYQCVRAESEPQYARYPRLPMLDCKGYEARQGIDDLK